VTKNSFIQSIEDSIVFLEEYGLFKGRGVKEVGIHSDGFKEASRSKKHTVIYRVAIENQDYEILLFDDSIFQFTWKADVLRYAFIQNPSKYATKEDLLHSVWTPDEVRAFSPEEYRSIFDNITDEDYEQFSNEQALNLDSNLIRYDMDEKGYFPLVHSYSHIHIGLNEHLRIPCSKVLTPLKFAIFSVKNTYFDTWKDSFRQEGVPKRIHDSKLQCANLPAKFWQLEEKYELFLF
jgi:hypothetical protein